MERKIMGTTSSIPKHDDRSRGRATRKARRLWRRGEIRVRRRRCREGRRETRYSEGPRIRVKNQTHRLDWGYRRKEIFFQYEGECSMDLRTDLILRGIEFKQRSLPAYFIELLRDSDSVERFRGTIPSKWNTYDSQTFPQRTLPSVHSRPSPSSLN